MFSSTPSFHHSGLDRRHERYAPSTGDKYTLAAEATSSIPMQLSTNTADHQQHLPASSGGTMGLLSLDPLSHIFSFLSPVDLLLGLAPACRQYRDLIMGESRSGGGADAPMIGTQSHCDDSGHSPTDEQHQQDSKNISSPWYQDHCNYIWCSSIRHFFPHILEEDILKLPPMQPASLQQQQESKPSYIHPSMQISNKLMHEHNLHNWTQFCKFLSTHKVAVRIHSHDLLNRDAMKAIKSYFVINRKLKLAEMDLHLHEVSKAKLQHEEFVKHQESSFMQQNNSRTSPTAECNDDHHDEMDDVASPMSNISEDAMFEDASESVEGFTTDEENMLDNESTETAEEELLNELGEVRGCTLHVTLLTALRAKFFAQLRYDVLIDIGEQHVENCDPTTDTKEYSVLLYNDDNTNIVTVEHQVREATGFDIVKTIMKVYEAHQKGYCVLMSDSSLEKCQTAVGILGRVGLQTRIVDYRSNLYEQLFDVYSRGYESILDSAYLEERRDHRWMVHHEIHGTLVLINEGNLGPTLTEDLIQFCDLDPQRADVVSGIIRNSSWCPLAHGLFPHIQRIYENFMDRKYVLLFQKTRGTI